jgi:hypothetical protein
MLQAVNCHPVAAETRIESRVYPCEVVVYHVTKRPVYLRVFLFSPLSNISPIPYTHLYLDALIRRTKGRSLGTVQKEMFFVKWGNFGQEHTSTFFFFLLFRRALWLMLPDVHQPVRLIVLTLL